MPSQGFARHFSVLGGLLIISLSLLSCSKQPAPHIPQEGELVTWYMTPELVIRTRLGERREHIVGRHDAEFYRPHFESYLGQFPLDDQPERLKTIGVAELKQWAADPMAVISTLEFNLMLNGSRFKATDESINGPKGLDHVDQVKVVVERRGLADKWTSTADEYKQLKARQGLREYDDDFSRRYDLACYTYIYTQIGGEGRFCYGQSSNPNITGVRIAFMGGSKSDWLYAESLEPIDGGLVVRWRIDRRNLAQWQEIDAAIWRFLDAWNVAAQTTAPR